MKLFKNELMAYLQIIDLEQSHPLSWFIRFEYYRTRPIGTLTHFSYFNFYSYGYEKEKKLRPRKQAFTTKLRTHS